MMLIRIVRLNIKQFFVVVNLFGNINLNIIFIDLVKLKKI
jgi:hypothetical protein